MMKQEIYPIALLMALSPLLSADQFQKAMRELGLEPFLADWEQAESAARKVLGTRASQPPTAPMRSVFERVRLEKAIPDIAYGYSPMAIDPGSEDIFPEKIDALQEQFAESLMSITAALEKDLEMVISNSKDSALAAINAGLLFLLEKYGARISCGLKGQEDVSLYDHARIRAAWMASQIAASDAGNEAFALVKMDLSGIQKFIFGGFDLSNVGEGRRLAKRLRGRSTFVSILTDFCIGEILAELDLQRANIIFRGAGVLLILVPQKVTSLIEPLLARLNLSFQVSFGVHLGVVHAVTQCGAEIFRDAAGLLTQVSHRLDESQYRRHVGYLRSYFNQHKRADFDKDTRIGRLFPKTRKMVKVRFAGEWEDKHKKHIVAAFPTFQTWYFMFNEEDHPSAVQDFLTEFADQFISVEVIGFNRFEIPKEIAQSTDVEFSTLLGGNHALKEKKSVEEDGRRFQRTEITEFEDLAAMDWSNAQNSTLNFPQLGIMRMDIDNLGAVFAIGLGQRVSLSRLGTLSREIDLFFGGWMNELARKWGVYVTYSGGDDGFVVGSWVNMVHFARELRQAFSRFTCHNPNLTMSAGLFVCRPFYPVGKFGLKAADLEDMAKTFVREDKKPAWKDSIAFMDIVLTWEEFEGIVSFALDLEACTAAKKEGGNRAKLARSMVQRIHQMINTNRDRTGVVKTREMYRYRAQLHYLMARHGFSQKKILKLSQPVLKKVVETFLTQFASEDTVSHYLIATQYVLMKTRQPKN